MKKPIIYVLLLLPIGLWSQEKQPLELAKEMFATAGEKDKTDAFIHADAELIFQNDTIAQISMHIYRASGEQTVYLEYTKTNRWQLSQNRSFCFQPIQRRLQEYLQSIYGDRLDSMIYETNHNGIATFSTKEDFLFERNKVALMLATDFNLHSYFYGKRGVFEKLKKDFLALGLTELLSSTNPTVKQLMLCSVEKKSNMLFFLTYNSDECRAGYVFVEDEKTLPRSNSKSFVVCIRITGGWYIYRSIKL